MRRWGISLPLLLGCVSRLATGGARVSLVASRGMPDNRHQRLWSFIRTRGFLGTAWCVFRSTLQGNKPIDCRPLTVIWDYLLHWPCVGGNRARRVDADTTAPWVLSLLSLATTRLLLLLAHGEETIKLNNTVRETRKYSADRRSKDLQLPSVLSSHYSVSVSLQGVHYL
jgi:hypothetical protein